MVLETSGSRDQVLWIEQPDRQSIFWHRLRCVYRSQYCHHRYLPHGLQGRGHQPEQWWAYETENPSKGTNPNWGVWN